MSKIPLPNYFQCPNMVVDEFMAVLSPASFKMMMFLIRQTVGFNSVITDSTPQSRVIDKTGMSRSTIWRAQAELKKHNLITVYGSKKEGYSYEVNYKIQHNYNFKTFLMFQNETLKKHGLMFQNETSYVSNLNILYILNTLIKDTNKKYIKKNEDKSATKSKKNELESQEVFQEFKSKFEFINFADYVKMVSHLNKLNKSVAKKRITDNLNKCKMKNGSFLKASDFSKVVDEFTKQSKYQGIFVSWEIQTGKKIKKENAADSLGQKKDENIMTDEELDAELAKFEGRIA